VSSQLNMADFDLLALLLKEKSGLTLTPDKSYLLESRLTPVARRHQLTRLEELIGIIRTRPTPDLINEIVEAMTTNESFFFRDNTPFDILKTQILPRMKIKRAARKQLRIWCAAASTGQEPYSIAMILDEKAAEWAGWTIEIIGTDISKNALARAEAGLYSQFEVQRGLPIQLLMKYFEKDAESWRISAKLRSMIKFKHFNLLDSFATLGQFDIIFCRNVLIYFDAPTKGRVMDNMRKQLPEDGSLFLGAAETVLGLTKVFRPVREHRGLYIPTESTEFQLAAAG
jgi:chemotaxis protein methyltransferase CheR